MFQLQVAPGREGMVEPEKVTVGPTGAHKALTLVGVAVMVNWACNFNRDKSRSEKVKSNLIFGLDCWKKLFIEILCG
jgi:hypothetical protein